MAVRRRKTTSTESSIETPEHVPDSRTVPAVSTESTLSHPQLRHVVGVGLFAVATVVLFGISLPFTPFPSSFGALAALSLAVGTLLVGTSTASRGETEPIVGASPTSDEAWVE